MVFVHKELAAGRWFTLSFFEQMANIGSEVERTISWRQKGDLEYSRLAFERALELIDLTLADSRWRKRLKEIARLREFLCDYFVGSNEYQTTDDFLHRYFYAFNYARAIQKR